MLKKNNLKIGAILFLIYFFISTFFSYFYLMSSNLGSFVVLTFLLALANFLYYKFSVFPNKDNLRKAETVLTAIILTVIFTLIIRPSDDYLYLLVVYIIPSSVVLFLLKKFDSILNS